MTLSCFPVVYSTLDAQALVTRVLSQYAIGNIRSCKFWTRGLSDIYLIETQDQPYVLRVSHTHWRCQADIEFELEVLEFLRRRNIPVAYPLLTQDQRWLIELQAPEGKRYATLFIYAPGKIPLGDFNQNQSRILGNVLAKLHLATTEFQTTTPRQALTLEYLLDQSVQTISPFIQTRPQLLNDFMVTMADIKQKLRPLPQEAPFWVICWGDPHSGNVHFTPNQQPTLFDFDQCGYGWRAFDVAKFLQVGLCTGMSYSVRDAFLEGYQSIQALSDLEFSALQPLTQVAYIWRWAISLNYALTHEYNRLDDYYFIHRIGQLKMLQSHNWQALQIVGQTHR
jgi:Ser/Thr protein kinase RdoA (MazF antagonist)